MNVIGIIILRHNAILYIIDALKTDERIKHGSSPILRRDVKTKCTHCTKNRFQNVNIISFYYTQNVRAMDQRVSLSNVGDMGRRMKCIEKHFIIRGASYYYKVFVATMTKSAFRQE